MTRPYINRDGQSNSKQYKKDWVRGWRDRKRLLNLIEKLGLQEDIIFLDYVSEKDLPGLYNIAELFAFPSFYEGFGLPVLEAMAQGAAVVTSNTTSLPEGAGDAGLYINTYYERYIASALDDIYYNGNYREELKKKAVIQAKKFSWKKTATEVLGIYNKVIDMPKFGGYPG